MKALAEYDRKRDFKKTPEPSGKLAGKKRKSLSFVVQEHHASHLHYDFRLELDGVLKSWAVPKGPSADPHEKRLAMEVEDHPLAYGTFEGMIPEGEYGGGEVLLWDTGSWEPTNDPHAGLKKGHLDFTLKGKRMKGAWTLIRTRQEGAKNSWLLFKRSDEFAGKTKLFHPIKDYGAWKESPEKTKKKPPAASKKQPAKKIATKQRSKKKLHFIDVQLPLLVTEPPIGSQWIHEIKFDGYRIQAILQNGKAKLHTRSGFDWTSKYPTIAKALETLAVEDAILDGEIVALDSKGRSDFQGLQLAMKSKASEKLKYFVFDLMELNGKDLRQLKLIERKELLQEIIPAKNKTLKFSDHTDGNGRQMLNASCKQELEGIVSKDKNSPYCSGRTREWMKSKCSKRQEFVIGGYSEPQGTRAHFGALLLGVYEKGKLKYVGRCGTGFDAETIGMLSAKLRKIDSKKSHFEMKSPKEGDVHFVKPTLVAEINFANWTNDELLRVPVFQGLRSDKDPKTIRREVESAPTEENKKTDTASTSSSPELTSIELTHPKKIYFAKEKILKQDVANFYDEIQEWILPQISNRPLSLMRCPEGTSKACFFNKHLTPSKSSSAHLHEVEIPEKSGMKVYASIDDAEGLRALVQMGGFEFHAWNAHVDDFEYPDQIVMDFDPSPEVKFAEVKKGALELKKILDHLKLKSFIKVTGGKGLHVHIPLAPLYTWDQIRDFSHTLALQMAEQNPDRYTAILSKAARKGKIFIDYLRNGRSATAVVPYSLRAKLKSSVAMPIEWNDLKNIKDPAMYTLEKAREHLKKRKRDPWDGYEELKQKISILKPARKVAD